MLKRLWNYLTKPIATPATAFLYTNCIAQARRPEFYRDLKVPDTIEGRFDLLTLHVWLVIHRLPDHPERTQQLFDLMFADMDQNLRELGVSDISIGKKMKPLMEAFYGRSQAYETAIGDQGAVLGESLRRNIYGTAPHQKAEADKLTNYVRRAHSLLAAQKTDDILAGHITFPPVLEDGLRST